MSLADRAMAHQNPKDAIEHATVICTPNAARLVRQHRLDGGPLMIAEFVAYDSRLRFGSFDHVLRGAVNPRRMLMSRGIFYSQRNRPHFVAIIRRSGNSLVDRFDVRHLPSAIEDPLHRIFVLYFSAHCLKGAL